MNQGSETLRVLLRAAAEVIYRLSSVKSQLSDVVAQKAGYRQLVDTLQTAIVGIEGLLPETFDSVAIALSDKDEADQGLEVLLANLQKISRWFVQLHELLVYLPRQNVVPEIAITLDSSFGRQYQQHSPSIILGSVFNAAEWDFFELLQRRIPDLEDIHIDSRENVVLELAICDGASPHAWAILAHEMGHAIDETAHISDGVANAFVKDTSTEAFSIVRSWCAEAAADLIAARVMGPAPMFALLSLEYCVYPMYSVHQPSKTHPATMWRFDSVTEYLKQLNGGLDLLSVERNRYHIAYEHSLMRAGHDKHARVRESNQRSYEFVFKPLVSAICDKIGKLNLEASKFDQESLDRCALRLKRGFPIAAQGVARKDLRSKIERYREQRPDLSGEQSGEPKRQRFAELAEEFAEKPLSIPTIIASGYLRRLELISAISERETLPEYSELERMCDDLRGLDELVLHSIRTSAIHKHIVDARTRGEA